MTENAAEPITPCTICKYMKPISRLRPFGENFTLICAECAFKDDEATERTQHMVWHLAQEILMIFGPDDAESMGYIAIEIPVDVLLGPDEDDNPAN